MLRERVITALILAALVLLVIFMLPRSRCWSSRQPGSGRRFRASLSIQRGSSM
jgi:hypothetical protein